MRVIQVDVIQENSNGIIYGNIQTESRLKDIDIYKVLINGTIDTKTVIRVRTFSNGNFIVENLKPGNYIISCVHTRNDSLDFYDFKSEIEFYSIQVRQGEVVYAGTYEIFLSKLNNEQDQVKVYRSALPTEKRILQHVSMVERNSIWAKLLRERMSKLI